MESQVATHFITVPSPTVAMREPRDLTLLRRDLENLFLATEQVEDVKILLRIVLIL